MNKLSRETRARVLHLLCEGSSIRSVERVTGVTKRAVLRLMIDAGKACAAYHDEHVRNLRSARIQVDENWSFTYAKQRNAATAKGVVDHAGDTWTWTAIDADNKLVVSWLVGGRDGQYALAFMDTLRADWLTAFS